MVMMMNHPWKQTQPRHFSEIAIFDRLVRLHQAKDSMLTATIPMPLFVDSVGSGITVAMEVAENTYQRTLIPGFWTCADSFGVSFRSSPSYIMFYIYGISGAKLPGKAPGVSNPFHAVVSSTSRSKWYYLVNLVASNQFTEKNSGTVLK